MTPGDRFGRLVVTRVGSGTRLDSTKVYARCDCGRRAVVKAKGLKYGTTRSCGCLKRIAAAKASAALVIHGDARSGAGRAVEYRAWAKMTDRCYNPRSPMYWRYGGRGIRVCRRWRSSYPAFLSDMGRRPQDKHCIDRIDNDLSYGPGNCRWASWRESSNNRGITPWLLLNGKKVPLGVAADRAAVSRHTLWYRLRRGWPHQLAVDTPPIRGGRPLPFNR